LLLLLPLLLRGAVALAVPVALPVALAAAVLPASIAFSSRTFPEFPVARMSFFMKNMDTQYEGNYRRPLHKPFYYLLSDKNE